MAKGSRWKFVLLATETLRVLHDSCPRIKSIRIEFPDGMDELFVLDDTEPSRLQLEARDIYGEPDLTIFKGLEELALDNLYAPWWRSQVVQTLQNSPTIRKLALSLSPETIFRYDGRGEIEMFHDFFDQLCDEYGATGAAPLPIQSLNLGTGIYPRRRSGIEQLVNFRDLEDVHVENRGVWSCYDLILMYDGGKENSGLVFDVFQPTQCPRLRRFTAAQYKPDVHRLLATKWDSTSARQLAISFTSIGNRYTYEPAMLLGEADSRHPSLPLHFRMLDIGFDADTTYLDDVLHDLVSGDDGALEGLVIPWHRVQTDQGVGFLHLDLIANAVAKLANLTQLRVIPNRWNREEIIGSEETQRIADILARAGPRLRYIQIQHRYLSIWRNRDGTIRLEELEDREIDDVELFSRTVWEPDMPQTHRG